jgi:dolichol-phosphate mannosyltransferase
MVSQLQRLVPCPTGPLQVVALPPENAPTAPPLTLSLIIPTYNEGQNLGPLITALVDILDPLLPNDYELIVVDDDSPDLTWRQGLAIGDRMSQLRVMRRQGERGLSSAVIRGWQVAQGRVLGVIDADLQHPPEVLQELLAAIQTGADLAVASRHVEGGGVS